MFLHEVMLFKLDDSHVDQKIPKAVERPDKERWIPSRKPRPWYRRCPRLVS